MTFKLSSFFELIYSTFLLRSSSKIVLASKYVYGNINVLSISFKSK